MNIPKSLNDLEAFIKDEVQENIHLDYKDSRALSRKKPGEISKDISAFANSDGGIIIYGIQEERHLPKAIDEGCDDLDITREWLEQVISSNIAPRIPDLRICQISISGGRSAYSIEVPKSYRGPHQDRVTKKYFKRYNFRSEAMEDYEIADIRARAQSVPPLVNVDVEIRHSTLFFLIIENVGALPAKDVSFSFHPPLRRQRDTQPPIFESGIRYLPPGRRFFVEYGTGPEILKEEAKIRPEITVTVSYEHPVLQRRLEEIFPINFRDYLGTWPPQSDVREASKEIGELVKKLTEELRKLNTVAEHLSSVAGVTGLELSIRTIRNLKHVLGKTPELEKFSPLGQEDPSFFVEILGIDYDLARRISRHFWNTESIEGLSALAGMTPDIMDKVRRLFFVIE